MTTDLFEALVEGIITPVISRRIQLEQVVDVHRDMSARATTGSIVLDL